MTEFLDRHDASEPELRRELILAPALVHTRPPAERIYANCSRVLRHALKAAGLWEEGAEQRRIAGFHEASDDPVVEAWYATLISLTRTHPPEQRLLDGGGNLDRPAGPYYTACWLTPAGIAEAERLLDLHPEWKERLQ